MKILEVKNLCKIYGKGENEVRAVDDISFSVDEGEFVAIVGASGSGKSTLLHLLGGVDRPTSGKVLIEDKDIYELSDDALAIFRRRQIGIIYQFYNLIPILNVKENITLPCDLDGKPVARGRGIYARYRSSARARCRWPCSRYRPRSRRSATRRRPL